MSSEKNTVPKKPSRLFEGFSSHAFEPEKHEEDPVAAEKAAAAAKESKIEKLKSTYNRRAYTLTNYNISRLDMYKALHKDDQFAGDVNKLVNELVGREMDRLGIKLPGEE